MRRALIVLCALMLDTALLQRAWGAQICGWIVESVEDGGTHKFDLTLSVDAPTSVSVRFKGPGFTSASMGGDMIQLSPGEPKAVDGEGFDVLAGDDLLFDVRLFDHPFASLDEMNRASEAPLATFTFQRTVGQAERAPPPDLAVKQCKAIG